MAENTRFVETKGDLKMFGSMSSEDFERLIAAGKVTEDLIDAFRRSREELVVTREEYKNLRDALDELEEESELFANGFTNNINRVLNGLQALGQTKLTTNLFKGALSNVGNINKELQAASMSGVQLSDRKFDSLSLKLSTASINFSSALSRISETLGVSQDLLQKISEEGADKSTLDGLLNRAVDLEDQILNNSKLSIKEKYNQLRTIEDTVDAVIALSHSELQYQKTLTDTGKLLESQKNTQFEINKALTGRTGIPTKVGVAGTLGKIAEKVGWKPLQQELQKQESVGKQKATEAYYTERAQKLGEGKTVEEAEQAGLAAAKAAGNGAISLAGAMGTALKTTVIGVVSKFALDMVKAIGKVSAEAANVKREIGDWSLGIVSGNKAFASVSDGLKTILDLVKETNLNPVLVFSDLEISKMAEAKNLMGLTAEEAVGLGIKSKLAGVSADSFRAAIAQGNNEVNRYGVAHGQVMDGVLQASDAITLSLGNHPGKIAAAVVEAKAMGMELREIEGIQQNLLNFESSIESEMKAQLLTGRNINLSRAREYALMNDLEGVAREIRQQGVDMATFGEMNVIQQESLAKALGMNREQLAKSIILQEMQNGLSAEAIAQSMNMNEESIKAMGIQERWNKSVEQLKESFAPILSMLIPILQAISQIVSWTGRFIGLLGKSKDYQKATNTFSDNISGSSFSYVLGKEQKEEEGRKQRQRREKEEPEGLGSSAIRSSAALGMLVGGVRVGKKGTRAVASKVKKSVASKLGTQGLLGRMLSSQKPVEGPSTEIERLVETLNKVNATKGKQLSSVVGNIQTAGQKLATVKKEPFLEVGTMLTNFYRQLPGPGILLKSLALLPATILIGTASGILALAGLASPYITALGTALSGFVKALSNASGAAIGAAVVAGVVVAIGGAMWMFGKGISLIVDSIGNFIPRLAGGIKQLTEIEWGKLKGSMSGVGTIFEELLVVNRIQVGNLRRLYNIFRDFTRLPAITGVLTPLAQEISDVSSKLSDIKNIKGSVELQESSQISKAYGTGAVQNTQKVQETKVNNVDVNQKVLSTLSRIEHALQNPIKLDWDWKTFELAYARNTGY